MYTSKLYEILQLQSQVTTQWDLGANQAPKPRWLNNHDTGTQENTLTVERAAWNPLLRRV